MDAVCLGVEKFADNLEVRVIRAAAGRGGRGGAARQRLRSLGGGAGQAESTAPCLQAAAKFIKDSMEKKYGPTWHVVCGEGFGFNVTYEQKHCL